MSRWIKSNTSVYNISYHIIWCPKGKVEIRLKEILLDKACCRTLLYIPNNYRCNGVDV